MIVLQVMYLRLTSGTENLPCAYAYIEFTNQPSVPIALQNNGIEFKGRCLRCASFMFLDEVFFSCDHIFWENKEKSAGFA